MSKYTLVTTGAAENVGLDDTGKFIIVDVGGEEYKDFATGNGHDNTNLGDGEEVNIYEYQYGRFTNYAIRRVADDDIATNISNNKGATTRQRTRSSTTQAKRTTSAPKRDGDSTKAPSPQKKGDFPTKEEREMNQLGMATSAARTAAIEVIRLMHDVGAIPAVKLKSTQKSNKGETYVLAMIEHYTRVMLKQQGNVMRDPKGEYDFDDILEQTNDNLLKEEE